MTNYPQNVTFVNFSEFLWTPILTYSWKYPRNTSRDIMYIIRKSIITILSIIAAYIIHTDYIMPHI
jgi:sterol O-acyltransferase